MSAVDANSQQAIVAKLPPFVCTTGFSGKHTLVRWFLSNHVADEYLMFAEHLTAVEKLQIQSLGKRSGSTGSTL
jgi:hypothetical protein